MTSTKKVRSNGKSPPCSHKNVGYYRTVAFISRRTYFVGFCPDCEEQGHFTETPEAAIASLGKDRQ